MPTEEELAIVTMVRDFAEHELRPFIGKYDEQPASGFPSDLMERIEQLGLTSVTIPEECGGAGLDLSIAGLVIEELAATCPGFAMILATSIVATSPLFLLEDKESARTLLQKLTAGGEFCHTAAILLPDTGRPLNITAVPDGDGFRLVGLCPFVINGGTSGLYTAFASTGNEIIGCAIPGNSPGLSFSKPIQKLGLNVVPCCDLTLEGVPVPPTHVLVRSDKASAILDRVEIHRHGLISATAVGCIRASLREATAYASERRQGGQVIAKHHAVSTLLANMEVGLAAASSVVHDSLACPDELLKTILARIHATETACTAAIDSVQVLGGYGYMRDLPVEKLMRDSQQMALLGGANGWLRAYLQHSP